MRSVHANKRKRENTRRCLRFHASHLAEVRVDVLSTPAVELAAADLFGEAGDANDVGGLHVFSQVVTARLGHILNLVPLRPQERERNSNPTCRPSKWFTS